MTRGKKLSIISGVMIAIIAIALIFVLVDDDNPIETEPYDTSIGYTDTANWMSYLDDSKYISEITIPGTHDSTTENIAMGYIMRCQNTSINQQLLDGYRYLDLRLAIDSRDEGDELKLVHNFLNCHAGSGLFSDSLHLEDVTKQIYSFLDEHPDETVIVNTKIEDDDHSVSEIQKLLIEEINENQNYWYTEETIPTLGEARGKIVLMTRFKDEAATGTTGIQTIWTEQDNKDIIDIPYDLYVTDNCRLWVQDRFKYSVDDKYDAVVDGLENCEADENTIFLNFVSTSGSGLFGHPKGYARKLNNMIMDYEFKPNTSYGIIVVDFGHEDLARHIYMSNGF